MEHDNYFRNLQLEHKCDMIGQPADEVTRRLMAQKLSTAGAKASSTLETLYRAVVELNYK